MLSAVLYRSTCRAQYLLPLTHGDKIIPAGAGTARASGPGWGTRSLTTPSTEGKPFSEIPGPRRLPLVGSSLSFLLEVGKKHILQLQKEWMEKYGMIYRIKVPTIPESVCLGPRVNIQVEFHSRCGSKQEMSSRWRWL